MTSTTATRRPRSAPPTMADIAEMTGVSVPTVSKVITPGVIYPIGIITALIGVPFFISLVMSIRNKAA